MNVRRDRVPSGVAGRLLALLTHRGIPRPIRNEVYREGVSYGRN